MFELVSKTCYLIISKKNTHSQEKVKFLLKTKFSFTRIWFPKELFTVIFYDLFNVFEYVISISCVKVILFDSFNWTTNIKYFKHNIDDVVVFMNFFQLLIVIVFKCFKWATLFFCIFFNCGQCPKEFKNICIILRKYRSQA